MILTAPLGSCVVQSLRTAHTSFAMIFEHCMFKLLSLRALFLVRPLIATSNIVSLQSPPSIYLKEY